MSDSKRDVILTHMEVDDRWPFSQLLSKEAGRTFHVESMSTGNGNSRLRCLWCYVVFPFLVFLRRKQYGLIVAHQQFFGILLAFYCRLFHVRKDFDLIVLTFIYLPKSGLIGRIYLKFIRYVAQSGYIDAFTVHSTSEPAYYASQLGIDASLFHYIPLGMNSLPSQPIVPAMHDRKYILAVGRSNRNYDFLIHALRDTQYQLDIICDTYHPAALPDNIRVHNNIFDEMPLWLHNCHCVVIPLRDPEVSSGQLVLLQALQLGKPVILTRSNALRDYAKDQEDCLMIENRPEQLLSALDTLYHDAATYQRLSENGKKNYQEYFTAEKQVENTAKVINAVFAS